MTATLLNMSLAGDRNAESLSKSQGSGYSRCAFIGLAELCGIDPKKYPSVEKNRKKLGLLVDARLLSDDMFDRDRIPLVVDSKEVILRSC